MMRCYCYLIKPMSNIKVKRPWPQRHCLHSSGCSATQTFVRKFHTLIHMLKRMQHKKPHRMPMDFSALIWEMCWAAQKSTTTSGSNSSNDQPHRKVLNRHAISSTIFPSSMASHSTCSVYQRQIECRIMMRTFWKNANYYCINIAYDRTFSAAIAKPWSE